MRFFSVVALLLVSLSVSFVASHPFHSESETGCSATYGQIEGPYWVDGQPIRSDITEGQPGVPLYLNLILLNQSSTSECVPLVNVAADIWHTNATGYYAHFTGYDPNEPAKGPVPQTDKLTFMRGVQLTNKYGEANFTTIYPGWYYGRCIHIHVEVHLSGNIVGGNFVSGGVDAYIGQLFFDDAITTKVAQLPPYSSHTQMTFLPNDQDYIYTGQHGAANQLNTVPVNPNDLSKGFTASFVLNVDTSALQQRSCTTSRQTPNFRSYQHLYRN